MSKTKGLQNIWVAFAGAVLAGTVALPQAVTAQEVTTPATLHPSFRRTV